MNSMNDTRGVAGPASGQTSHIHRLRGLAGTGFIATLAAMVASARPADLFVRTAVSLTAISLLPPLLSEAATATTTALLGLHLVAATVMISTLARSLRKGPSC